MIWQPLLLSFALIGADVEIINLPDEPSPAAADVMILQKDGGGAGSSKKVSVDNLTGDFITADSTDTLTNKTLDSETNTVHADAVHLQVRNVTGLDTYFGQVVYISGYNPGLDLPEVDEADADGASTYPAIGLMTEVVAHNAAGSCLISGRLVGTVSNNLVTNTFLENASVYLSTTPGGFSARPSTAVDEVQKLGVVLRSHLTLGVIELVGAGRTNDIPNKQLDTIFRVADDGNNTRLLVFEASGITAGQTRIITMPDKDVTLDTTTDTRTPTAHKDSHKSGGGDALLSTDLLEAIVKRLQVTGPVTLTMGAVADGEVLVRSGTDIVGATAPSGVGADYQYVESESRDTTSSASYALKTGTPDATLTTPALTGTYRVSWCGKVDCDDVEGQWRLQNTTDAATLDEAIVRAPTNTVRIPVGGFREVTFTGAAKTFEIQFRDEAGGGNEVGLGSARIEIWRVGP